MKNAKRKTKNNTIYTKWSLKRARYMQSLYVRCSWACWERGGGVLPSCLAALALLLFALELSQPSRPNVPPLDDQAVLVGQQPRPLSPALTGAHHQETFAHLDFGALAGQVLHVDPQEVVTSLQRLPAALVDSHDVDRELGPVSDCLHV